jgi:hypothetical protein
MASENPDAYLEKPKFGKMPAPTIGPKAEPVYNFVHLLEACRERPGEEACIAEFSRGGKKRTLMDCRTQVGRIQRYLWRYVPLEDWEVNARFVTDTWQDHQIWVCYYGVMSEDEAAKDHELRILAYSSKLGTGDVRVDRENRAKYKAIRQQHKERRRARMTE